MGFRSRTGLKGRLKLKVEEENQVRFSKSGWIDSVEEVRALEEQVYGAVKVRRLSAGE